MTRRPMTSMAKREEVKNSLSPAQLRMCQGMHETMRMMFRELRHRHVHTTQIRVHSLVFFCVPSHLGIPHWATLHHNHIDMMVNPDLAQFLIECEPQMLKTIKEAKDHD